jgi:ATP-dependent Clp protease adaptor protein ClpS
MADDKDEADVNDGPFSQFESWKNGSVLPGVHFCDSYSESVTLLPPKAAGDPDGGGKEGGGGGDKGNGTAVITRTRTQTRKPAMYRVLLLNDDYTPMEFVVTVLKKYFNKGPEDATRIMLHVHQHGVGECGVFTYEVAETKVTQVMDYARKHQHPLQCIMEKN